MADKAKDGKKTILKDSRAIRKLNAILDINQESPTTLAEKLGCARGTLLSILAGRVSPRFEVMQKAKDLGVQLEDWGRT